MSPEQRRSMENTENEPAANRNPQHNEANVIFRGHLKLWDETEKKWTKRFFVLFRDHSLLSWEQPPADFSAPLLVFDVKNVEVSLEQRRNH